MSLTEVINHSRKRRFCGWNLNPLISGWAVNLERSRRQLEICVQSPKRELEPKVYIQDSSKQSYNGRG